MDSCAKVEKGGTPERVRGCETEDHGADAFVDEIGDHAEEREGERHGFVADVEYPHALLEHEDGRHA